MIYSGPKTTETVWITIHSDGSCGGGGRIMNDSYHGMSDRKRSQWKVEERTDPCGVNYNFPSTITTNKQTETFFISEINGPNLSKVTSFYVPSFCITNQKWLLFILP